MKNILTIIIALIAGVAGAFGYNKFFAGKSEASTASQNEIRAFLKNNPLEIYNAVISGQAELQKQKNAAAKLAVKNNLDEIENSKDFPSFGNEDAENIIVKFSDYNCGYCKKAGAVTAALAEKRDDVKVVVKDYPILGQASTIASKVALAVHDQFPEKYEEFHFALLKQNARSLEGALKAVEAVGIDSEQIRKTYNNSKYQDKINENLRIGQLIGVSGTPAFVINGELVPGYIDENRLSAMLK